MAKRQQKRLIISDKEISLIKGIIAHTDLNDQMIVAIFSHKSRTINHREIGYFRDGNNSKYQNGKIASKDTIKHFLSKYDKFELLTKVYGLQPKEKHFQLIQKGSEALKNAVSIYNNPNITWKSEIFIVNAVIAWTYLIHAYYMTQNVDYRYKDSDGNIILINEKQPKLWELSKCITINECPLPKLVKTNLRYLIAIRNVIEHSMAGNLDHYLGAKLQACALNFNHWLCEWFGKSFSIAQELSFAIQFSEISLKSHKNLAGSQRLPSAIETVNRLIERELTSEEYNDPQYSYRVFIVPRTINNRNKADQAATYTPYGSEVEMAVREVERAKYTASDIVNIMKSEGHNNFSIHGKNGFVAIWKSVDGKNLGKGLGVEVAGHWYWYENIVDVVRSKLLG